MPSPSYSTTSLLSFYIPSNSFSSAGSNPIPIFLLFCYSSIFYCGSWSVFPPGICSASSAYTFKTHLFLSFFLSYQTISLPPAFIITSTSVHKPASLKAHHNVHLTQSTAERTVFDLSQSNIHRSI